MLVLDHLFTVLLVVVVPLFGVWSYRRLAQRIAAGETDVLLREYGWTIAMECVLAGGALAVWSLQNRPLAALGLALPPSWRTVLGVGITAGALVLLLLQWRAVQQLDAAGLEEVKRQLHGASAFLPRTAREARRFRWLALSAGVCEELAYRGYLVGGYMVTLLGIDPWLAAVLGALVFGACHGYQGMAGVAKTAIAGLLAGLLFVASGSLLWPMILHTVVDLQGGAIGRRALGEGSKAPQIARRAPR